MITDAGRQYAAKLFEQFDCCPRCVLRMLGGIGLQASDLVRVDGAVRTSPLCPLCCGLLHHPALCTLDSEPNAPSDSSGDLRRDNLENILSAIEKSDFKYRSCQIKINEPITVPIHEYIIWSRLHQMAVNKCDSECTLTETEVRSFWKKRVGLKLAWQWVISPVLSAALKVPVIGEMEELNDTVYVKMNNLDPNAYNLECTLLRVFAEFSDPTAESECAAFVKLMANCEHPAVQEWTDRMANGPKRKRRRRRSTRRLERPEVTDSQAAKTSDDDDSANIQTGLSKTRLLPLLNDLFEHSIYICPELDLVTSLAVLHSLTLGRSVPMIVAGRYVKLNRRLPQTPWIVNYERKLPSSVEELIVDPLTAQFGSDTHTTFTSSGREDVDARCLGLGRPFMITMENYRGYVPEILSRFSAQADSPDCCVQSSETRVCELLRLATLINAQSKGKVFVRDLQLVRSKTATKAIKDGELQKSKTYRALCWCPGGGLNTQLIKHFATSYKSVSPLDALQWPPESKGDSYGFVQFGPIRIRQPTPIRVLHRRPLLNRIRTIHSLCLVDYKEAMKQHIPEMADFESWMKLYSPEELFFVELRCEAGTYVKEFVHGDLGRCQPSLASIFNRQIDILALDVTAVELDWPPRLPDPKSD